MSWRSKEDLGCELVAHVHESLRIPADYTCDEVRGFEWWAADYGQRIWSDLGNFHNSTTLYRLHSEIDFLNANGNSADAELDLARTMANGSLSAVVFDAEKDLFKLHCSIYANSDNEPWVRRVFNAAIALQIADVHRYAQRFAKEFKMTPTMSEHPAHGRKKTHDPVCEFEEKFFKPYGAKESRWVGVEEWEDGRQALRRISNDVKTDHKLCLEASFDWTFGQRDMTLLISAVDPHPILGNGLAVYLTLPIMMEDPIKAHVAFMLNEQERNEWNWYNDVGTWCVKDGELTFVCFVPNVAFMPGILGDFAHDMGIRANWVHENWGRIAKQAWG